MPADPNRDDATAETNEATPDDVPRRIDGGDPDEYVNTEKWVEAHQFRYDHTGDGGFVAALVSAVADAKGVDPLDYREMPPLYDSFDIETLEETFFGRSRGAAEGIGMMTFTYDDSRITLRSDGWIFVYEPR